MSESKHWVVWAGMGCGTLVGWCVWSALCTAAPWPMLALNGALFVGLAIALALPAARRAGSDLAERLVSGRASGFVLVSLVLMVLASGAALSILVLVSPPAHPEVQANAPDGAKVEAWAGENTSV